MDDPAILPRRGRWKCPELLCPCHLYSEDTYCLYGSDSFATSEPTMASKQPWRSDLTSDLKSVALITYVHIHMHIVYMVWTLLTALEATMASKQPWRSDLTSDLKSVVSKISCTTNLVCTIRD